MTDPSPPDWAAILDDDSRNAYLAVIRDILNSPDHPDRVAARTRRAQAKAAWDGTHRKDTEP